MTKQASKPPAGGGRVYLKLLDHLADSAFLADSNGKLLYVNVAACRGLGYTREELLSLSVPDFSDGAESKLEKAFAAAANGEPVTIEGVHRRKDGTPVPVELRISPIEIDGRLCVLGLARDITKRKQAEELQREHSERLEILFEYAPDAYYLNDLNGCFVEGNSAAVKLSGYGAEELRGASFLEVGMLPEDQLQTAAELLARNRRGESTGPDELTLIRKDGTQARLEITTHPVTIGNQPLVLGLARDITDRKLAEDELRRARDELESRVKERTADLAAANEQLREEITEREDAEKALRKSEEKYRELVENLHDIIYEVDAAGRVVYVNEAAESVAGYNRSDIIGCRFTDFLHPDQWQTFGDNFRRAISSGIAGPDDYRILSRTGETLWFRAHGRTVYKEGRFDGFRGILTDITERKQAEAALRESEERFRSILLSAPDAVVAVGHDGDISLVNDEAETLFGYAQSEMIGQPIELLVPAAHRGDHVRKRLEFVAAPRRRVLAGDLEITARHKDGHEIPVDINLSPVESPTGPIVVAVVRDVTDRKQTEAALRESEQRLRAIFEAAVEGIVIHEDGVVLDANAAFEKMFGYSLAELKEMSGFDLVTTASRQPTRHKIETGIEEPYEAVGLKKDGTTFEIEVVAKPQTFEGRLVRVAAVRDITDRKQAEETIRRMAYHDALTGLPNRELLKDRLDVALAQARRSGNMVAVMYLDLDRFKNINDTLGHPAGDKLMQRVGRQLSRLVRDGDTVARIGGDEFVMLLPEIERIEEAIGVGDRTLKRLSRKRTLLGQEIVVTTSIGISLYPPDGDNAEDLLSHADTAMYRAKDRGRNQCQLYDPGMTADIEQRLVIEAELRHALENDEIVAYFQPQLDVATGRLLGAEALARWHHPQRGLVLPDDFIQIAEETELSLLITEQVLRSAAALHVEIRNMGLPPMRMAINLGPAELYESALPQVVARILTEAGMAPEYLQVEITEQEAMRDPDLALHTLTDLHSQGVQIAVDDFGTGHSSLVHLRRFPVSVVKVDRSFIRDLEDDDEDATIVSAIISMAKSLDLNVVAEGVETEAQLQFLRERGCDEYQGYLFSPAIPARDFMRLLKASATGAEASSRGAP